MEYTQREDIAILLINQHVRAVPVPTRRNSKVSQIQIAEKIRPAVDRYQQAFPALLEIPSKDHPYGTHQALSWYNTRQIGVA